MLRNFLLSFFPSFVLSRKELIKYVLHTELLLHPVRGYLLVRKEKAYPIIVRRDRKKIAAPKSFEIMSVVTVNKISQTTQCWPSQ